MAKKIFSTELDEGILDAFTAQVTERRYFKYRAVEAAMKLFMQLPPESQAALMKDSSASESVIENILEKIVDKKLDEYFAKQKKRAKS